MEKKIIRRKVADKTRAKILKAARRLFAASGFSGTSTLAIAKAAKINETLIFHHFGNKEKLWKAVKADLVASLPLEPLKEQPETLAAFLKEIFTQRLLAYQANPELLRLMQWQQLETRQEALLAGNLLAPTNWLPLIQHLQKTGKIQSRLQPEFIMLWLCSSINLLIFNPPAPLQEKTLREAYLDYLVKGFERALQHGS